MNDFGEMDLLQVAMLNTPDALDHFWANVDEGYFEDRIEWYQCVASKCQDILIQRDWQNIALLDVGCAHGHFLRILAECVRDNLLFADGIDYAESAVFYAKERTREPRCNYFVMDITHPDMNTVAAYDLVTCLQTLEHIKEWERAIENINSLTMNDGDFVITIPNGETDRWGGHVNFWILEEMCDHLSQYGEVRAESFNDGHNLFFRVRKQA